MERKRSCDVGRKSGGDKGLGRDFGRFKIQDDRRKEKGC